jgi:SAM-dependent methyltransferase
MQGITKNAAPVPADVPGAAQASYWNSPATAPWVALQERLDALLAPLSRAALERAAPLPGEHALDVGCGCGATVLELARRVGPSGRVQGVDISAQMLERAKERAAAQGLTEIALTLADAAIHAFTPAGFDLVFSRLGVMFFGDPVAAFANLHRALKSSGRLVFLCCRSPAENRYITAAVQAARPLLPPGAMPIPGPEEPGMFSLADPDRVRRVLESAGFRDVALVPHDERMRLAGPGGAAEAAAFSLQFGPLTRVMDEGGPELSEAILAAVTEAYRGLEGPDGIVLDGAFWIVIARP